MIYERVCPVCGTKFESHHKRSVYDKDICRVKASRARNRLASLPKPQKQLLKQIRSQMPKTADHIEAVIRAHGTECAESVINACFTAVTEFKGWEQKQQTLQAAGD